MNKLKDQIKSYEEQLRNMTVMDDYDGGQAAQLRQVIDDLRELDGTKFSKHWYEKHPSYDYEGDYRPDLQSKKSKKTT
tara:strand:- start:371 stop:604 length:234 start_codon:yes stop_codon:yes gene_type:complete